MRPKVETLGYLIVPVLKRRSTAEMEVDGEGGFYFSGLLVEQVGAIACVADSLERGGLKYGWAADDLWVFDVARFGDDGVDDDRAFSVGGAGDGWVLGADGIKEVAGEDSIRDVDWCGVCDGCGDDVWCGRGGDVGEWRGTGWPEGDMKWGITDGVEI